MNTIHRILTISALTMSVALPMAAHAQADSHAGHMSAHAPASMTEGEVKKVDLENGKITLKHGDIKHLDMPGMTMAFLVKDKGLLAKVKPGDKVQFIVVYEGAKMVVTDVRPAR